MITYNVKDIIRKAEQFSDLENSSFLTWNEKMTRLNDAYTTLYQTVINHNDKYFYKSFTLNNVKSSIDGQPASYALPSDFYQLASITTIPDCTAILRKSATESEKCLRYDIVGGNLLIYGYCVSNINISYWPIPGTLTFKNDDVKIDASFTYLDCCNDNYLYKNGQEVYVYNINTSASTLLYTVPTGNTLSNAKIGINNIVLVCGTSDSKIFTVYIDSKNYSNITTSSSISTPLSFGLVKAEKKAYFRNTNTVSSYYWMPTYSQQIDFTISLPTVSSSLFTYGLFGHTITLDENNIPYWFNTEAGSIVFGSTATVYKDGVVSNVVEFENGDLYYDDAKTGKIYCNTSVVDSNDSNRYLLGINKVDCDTGYGLTVLRSDGYYIISPFANTELNYPSTFYFTYLAYMLAIQFKTKQNADVTLLTNEASSAETRYYDSLDNDSNANYRIKNDYRL